jgi:hypothetical protein
MVVLDHVSEESNNYKSEHRLRLLEQTSEAFHADEEERRRKKKKKKRNECCILEPTSPSICIDRDT